MRVFTLSLLFFIVPAQGSEEVKFTPELQQKMIDLQKGHLNRLEKIKLADDLQKAGAKDEALALYEENLDTNSSKDIPDEAYLNYGTGLLEKGNVTKGLAIYDELIKRPNLKPSIKEMMNQNVAAFFKTQEEKKKQQKKEDKKEDQDKNKKGQDQSGEQSGKQQDKSSKGDQNKKNNPEQNQQDNQKKKEEEKKNQEDEKKSDDNKDSNQDKNPEQKKLPPPKLEPKLKQLMSDDRQLQLKMIEQGTREMNRRKNRENKDW